MERRLSEEAESRKLKPFLFWETSALTGKNLKEFSKVLGKLSTFICLIHILAPSYFLPIIIIGPIKPVMHTYPHIQYKTTSNFLLYSFTLSQGGLSLLEKWCACGEGRKMCFTSLIIQSTINIHDLFPTET